MAQSDVLKVPLDPGLFGTGPLWFTRPRTYLHAWDVSQTLTPPGLCRTFPLNQREGEWTVVTTLCVPNRL